MPARAYLRLDPHVYDRKVLGVNDDGDAIGGWQPYSADALVAFFGTLALADMQPERGTFRSERILRELLRGTAGLGARYARQVPALIARGDLIVLDSGRLYVDGWREWQEGDLTVHERMRRYRSRKAEANGVTPAVTPPVTDDVTQPVTAPPSDGRRRRSPSSGGISTSISGGGGGVTERSPTRSMTGDQRAESIAVNRGLLSSSEVGVRRAAVRALKRLDPETDWAAQAEAPAPPAAPTARPRPTSA